MIEPAHEERERFSLANNGRVFISHSHDDNARCAPLLTALDAWGIDYFFDTQGLTAGQQLNERIQREISSRDIMLRVCTAATQQSFWMSLEGAAFRGLQAMDQRKGRGDRRVLINLILDSDYTREPFEAAMLFIDTVRRPRAAWLGDLARALGVTGAGMAKGLSRREMLGFGAASAVAFASVATAGGLYEAYHPASVEAATAPHFPGSLLWTLPHVSAKPDVPPIPRVSGDTLYVMTLKGMSAFDLTRMADGRPTMLWSHGITAIQALVGPVAAGSVVFTGVDSTVYAFDAHTGAKRWAQAVTSTDGNIFSTPLVQGGSLYFVTDQRVLYAVDATNGSVRWHAQVDHNTPGLLEAASGPAADDALVFIGSGDHHVYAYDAHSGSVRWKTLTRGRVLSTPVTANGVVYVGSVDHHFYALDARDGSVRWKYLAGDAVNSTPVVTDGVAYFASDDHFLYALDADTGSPYWRAPLGNVDAGSDFVNDSGTVSTGLTVTGDCVSVLIDTIWVVRSHSRADGSTRWTYTSKDQLQNASPVGARGVIYFGSGDDTLYAFGA